MSLPIFLLFENLLAVDDQQKLASSSYSAVNKLNVQSHEWFPRSLFSLSDNSHGCKRARFLRCAVESLSVFVIGKIPISAAQEISDMSWFESYNLHNPIYGELCRFLYACDVSEHKAWCLLVEIARLLAYRNSLVDIRTTPPVTPLARAKTENIASEVAPDNSLPGFNQKIFQLPIELEEVYCAVLADDVVSTFNADGLQSAIERTIYRFLCNTPLSKATVEHTLLESVFEPTYLLQLYTRTRSSMLAQMLRRKPETSAVTSSSISASRLLDANNITSDPASLLRSDSGDSGSSMDTGPADVILVANPDSVTNKSEVEHEQSTDFPGMSDPINESCEDVLMVAAAMLANSILHSDGEETASLPKHVVEIPALPSVAELAVKVSSGRLWDLKLGLSGMRDDESSFWALGGDSFTALTLLEKVASEFGVKLSFAELNESNRLTFISTVCLRALTAASTESALSIQSAELFSLPLLPLQHRIITHSLLQQHSDAFPIYNMQFAYQVVGTAFQPERLRVCLLAMLRRHASLRATISETGDGVLKQEFLVLDSTEAAVKVVDQTIEYFHLDELCTRDERIIQTGFLLRQHSRHEFVLASHPKLHLRCITVALDRHCLSFAFHHSCFDGVSWNIFINEFQTCYLGLSLPPLVTNYAQIVCSEHRKLEQGAWVDEVAFWQHNLKGLREYSNALPYDRPHPSLALGLADSVDLSLDPVIQRAMTQYAKNAGCSLYVLILCSIQAFFSRISCQTDFCIGAVQANRDSTGAYDTIGAFVNTFALRQAVNPLSSFTELCAQTMMTWRSVSQHWNTPWNMVVEALNPVRSALSPIFQLVFSASTVHPSLVNLAAVGIETICIDTPWPAIFDLNINLAQQQGVESFELNFAFSCDVFDRGTIDTLSKRFHTYLSQLFGPQQRHSAPLRTLCIQLPQELAMMQALNETHHDFGLPRTISAILAESCAKWCDSNAVTQCGVSLTYGQLYERADRIARFLQHELGLQPGAVVAICGDKSIDYIVGTAGIMLGGFCYFGVSPVMTPERVIASLSIAGAACVIRCGVQPLADKIVAVLHCPSVLVETAQESGHTQPIRCVVPNSNLPLYVITTSGSTGLPKQVLITNDNFLNLFHCMHSNKVLPTHNVFLQLCAASFDAHIVEMFPALCSGTELVLLAADSQSDLVLIADTIQARSVTIALLVPSLAQVFVEYLDETQSWYKVQSLKQVIMGGEAVSAPVCYQLAQHIPNLSITNFYGPAECSIVTACCECCALDSNEGAAPIGTPLANYTVLIVDDLMCEVAVGSIGQLYVGGVGVFPGYANQPELTAKVIVDLSHLHPAMGRAYRTGDLVRLLPSGQMMFMGRVDFQVKIRGQRMELGEIESVISLHPAVSSVVVIKREDSPGQPYLCAYVAPRLSRSEVSCGDVMSTHASLEAELVALCRSRLASYMVPPVWMIMAQLPLNGSGKVDRKQLPVPVLIDTAEHASNSPTDSDPTVDATSLGGKILAMFRLVLQCATLRYTADFFASGGNSLLAVKLISRIKADLAIKITLRDFFAHPSASSIATFALANTTAITVVTSNDVRFASTGVNISVSTRAQHSIYLHQLLYSADAKLYRIPLILRMRGPFDMSQFVRTLEMIQQRNHALRSRLSFNEANQLIITVADNLPLRISEESTIAECQIKSVVASACGVLFDLESDLPLWSTEIRSIVAVAGANADVACIDHLVTFCFHHLIFDGESCGLFLNELRLLYGNEPIVPNSQAIQYIDFAVHESNNTPTVEDLQFWESALTDTKATNLPLDRSRPHTRLGSGDIITLRVGTDIVTAIEAMQTAGGSSLFMVLLSVSMVFLQRICCQNDICVGSVVSQRNVAELASVIGMLVNTIAFRVQCSSEETFDNVLARVRDLYLATTEHWMVPWDAVLQHLKPVRVDGIQPYFQVMVTFDSEFGVSSFRSGSAVCECLPYTPSSVSFDLNIDFVKRDDGLLLVNFVFATDIFDRSTIETMSHRFEMLLEQLFIGKHSNIKLKSLDLQFPDERILMSSLNATYHDFGTPYSVSQLFAESCLKRSGRTAISQGDRTITYGDLFVQADCIARYLQHELHLAPGAIVAICGDRHFDYIVGTAGIILGGFCYFGVAPVMTPERVIASLSIAGVACVLRCGVQPLADKIVTALHCPSVAIDFVLRQVDVLPIRSEVPCTNLPLYIITTSGSTGTPKQVLITNDNFWNLFHSGYVLLPENSVYIQLCATSFDAHIYEMFPSLCSGTELVLLPPESHMDLIAIAEAIQSRSVTVAVLVPSLAQVFVEYLDETDSWHKVQSLRRVIMGGEAVSAAVCRRWSTKVHGISVIDIYGPAECTMVSAYCECGGLAYDEGAAPIGTPIANYTFLIVDEMYCSVPVGAVGQLYVGGPGVFPGYINQQSLTDNVIVDLSHLHPAMGRAYRTGDLVRLLSSAEVMFVGRVDFQVKIRGQRMELGEIESVISLHPAVSSVVVIKREDNPGQPYLCAYVAPRLSRSDVSCGDVLSTHASLENELVALCRSRLASYMVPPVWMIMAQLPHNGSGKVDRKQLPMPLLIDTSEYASNSSVIDAVIPESHSFGGVLLAMFRQVLQSNSLRYTADFFASGGNSLLAVKLIARIKAELDIKVSLRDFFSCPSPSTLAIFIGSNCKINTAAECLDFHIAPSGVSSSVSTLAQKSIFLHQSLFSENANLYRIPLILRVHGALDFARLRIALCSIQQRNHALRSTVSLNEANQLIISVVENFPLRFSLELEIAESQIPAIVSAACDVVFNLESGLALWSTQIYPVTSISFDDDFLVTFCFHHLVFDGESCGIFLNELRLFYGCEPIVHEPPAIQYIDFAVHEANNPPLIEDLKFWERILAGADFNVINLPLDRPRPTTRLGKGDTVCIMVDADVVKYIRDVQKESGSSLFMVLLSVSMVFLQRICCQNDICVGSVVSQRNVAELASVIGMLVNTIAFRLQCSSEETFNNVLARVRDLYLATTEHWMVPWDAVLQHLKPAVNAGTQPYFQTMVSLDVVDTVDSVMTGCTTSLCTGKIVSAIFDLDINFVVNADVLSVNFIYATDIFDRSTVEYVAARFEILLVELFRTQQRHVSIRNLNLHLPRETTQLQEFNATFTDFGVATPIGVLFIQCCRQFPSRIAVSLDGSDLSFSELLTRATIVARHLQHSIQLPQGAVVGVCVEKSFDMIIAIAATLVGGFVYMPIPYNIPSARCNSLLEQGCVAAMLSTPTTNAFVVETCPAYSAVPVTDDGSFGNLHICSTRPYLFTLSALPVLQVPYVSMNADLYIITTSGSTGRPKCIAITNASFCNYIGAWHSVFWNSPPAECSILQMCQSSFDAHLEEIVVPLCSGSRIVLLRPVGLLEFDYLTETIERYSVTHLDPVPSLMQNILDFTAAHNLWSRFRSVRSVFLGGEAPSREMVHRLQRNIAGVRVLNTYGPAEATIVSTYFDCTGVMDQFTGPIPIGKPLPNYQCLVVDDNMCAVPVGTIGQLCIGGPGLFSRYVNSPDLTAAALIDLGHVLPSMTRAYKTGDLVKMLPSGDLVFAGRVDFQVKIRGQRLELGEIESIVQTHPGVNGVLVMKREDAAGNAFLCAYVSFTEAETERNKDLFALQKLCAKRLPSYMLPSAWVLMKKLPLNANGKIDRRALPEPTSENNCALANDKSISLTLASCNHCALNSTTLPHSSTLTDSLLALFRTVLAYPTLLATADIFSHGASSLSVALIISHAKRSLQLSIPAAALFQFSTAQSLACYELFKSHSEFVASDTVSVSALKESIIADAQLDGDIVPSLELVANVTRVCSAGAILVTGGSGFVGSYIVKYLLLNTQAVIYLLNRSDISMKEFCSRRDCTSHQCAFDDSTSRVKFIIGDLSKPRFGWTDELYGELACTVDVVFHVAAHVNHVLPYKVLRQINICGTKEVLRFCAISKLKPIHFTSTVSIFETGYVDETSRALTVPDYGYPQSKWAMENLLHQAAERGFIVSIYRLAYVSGCSGCGGMNASDSFNLFVKGCLEMHAYPIMDSFPLQFNPVDLVAQSIVQLSHHSTVAQPGTALVYHVFEERPISTDMIFAPFKASIQLQRILPQDWFHQLGEISADNALFKIATAWQTPSSATVHLPVPLLVFDSSRTRSALVSTCTSGKSALVDIDLEQLVNVYTCQNNFPIQLINAMT